MKSSFLAVVFFSATFAAGVLFFSKRGQDEISTSVAESQKSPPRVEDKPVLAIPPQSSTAGKSSEGTGSDTFVVPKLPPAQRVEPKTKAPAIEAPVAKTAPQSIPEAERDLVKDIQVKKLLETDSKVIITLKGRLLNAYGTGEKTIPIRALDSEGVELGVVTVL